MSIFYSNYKCHPGAIVMRKTDGDVHRVHGNVSLWSMDVVIVPLREDVDLHDDLVAVLEPEEFFCMYLILDEGEDRLKVVLDALAAGVTNPRKV